MARRPRQGGRWPLLSAPLDLARVRTYPLRRRRSQVALTALARPPRVLAALGSFLDSLPDVLAARDLRTIVAALGRRHRGGKTIVLGMGAHPIKVGLSPLVIDLMRRGIVNAVAMNGAAIIHDFELAAHGATSEDVAAGLVDGQFGMAEETGAFLNRAIVQGRAGGLGTAVGRAILAARCRHRALSILAAGVRFDVPVTVHVAIGTDIIHMHPSADGGAIGATSLHDFHRLAGIAQTLHGGAFINLGSAVIIPEVFLKALNLARNVGRRIGNLLTVDMDFIRHYRPLMNVVRRPTVPDGQGYQLTGHHEIMFPLLYGALLDRLSRRRPRAGRSRTPTKRLRASA